MKRTGVGELEQPSKYVRSTASQLHTPGRRQTGRGRWHITGRSGRTRCGHQITRGWEHATGEVDKYDVCLKCLGLASFMESVRARSPYGHDGLSPNNFRKVYGYGYAARKGPGDRG